MNDEPDKPSQTPDQGPDQISNPVTQSAPERLVSWDEFHQSARALANVLRDGPSSEAAEARAWHRVVAITRGGMVPACIVARELGIRRVEAVSVVSYDHQTQGALSILTSVSAGEGADATGTLVIDDLVDTGKTILALREILPSAHFATVYAKPLGEPCVDTFVERVNQEVWIHLPWDLGLGYASPLIE